jgi:hypothetical protein
MCKVFLIVPTGVDGHAEVGHIGKLDLEDLGFFLGHDDVNIWNGWPIRQLPFLALSILQPIRRLERGTHFGMLPESGTSEDAIWDLQEINFMGVMSKNTPIKLIL